MKLKIEKFTNFIKNGIQICVCHFFVVILSPNCAHERTLMLCARINMNKLNVKFYELLGVQKPDLRGTETDLVCFKK